MEKAILVLNMPSTCAECSLCKRMKDNCYYCMATNQIIVDVGLKTHWCPLRKVPQKQIHSSIDDAFMRGAMTGYNWCINEILG